MSLLLSKILPSCFRTFLPHFTQERQWSYGILTRFCTFTYSSTHLHFPKCDPSIMVSGQMSCHMLSVNWLRYTGHNAFVAYHLSGEFLLTICTSLHVESTQQCNHFASQLAIYVNFNIIPLSIEQDLSQPTDTNLYVRPSVSFNPDQLFPRSAFMLMSHSCWWYSILCSSCMQRVTLNQKRSHSNTYPDCDCWGLFSVLWSWVFP